MRTEPADLKDALPRVDHGTAALTITNGNGSASMTVTHKLGVKPRRILVTARTAPFGAYAGNSLVAYSETSTTFGLYGFNHNSYTGGVVVNVDWVAIA